MGAIVHTIPMGIDYVYVIKERGTVVIDGGSPKKEKVFLKGFEAASIKPKDVRLIILTHGHWDHIGSAADIKEITGAQIVMHEEERKWLETPLKKMPPGVNVWGKTLSLLIAWLVLPFIHLRSTAVDIAVTDDGLSLEDYGIAGRILSTPGHTAGSISVLLNSGEAFVGDLAMNLFPLCLSPGLPIFAEDMSAVLDSWRKLLAEGVKTIYPSHGVPFSVDLIREKIEKQSPI